MPRSDDRGTMPGRQQLPGRCGLLAAPVGPHVAERRRRVEDQAKAVDAVAQSGRLRAVVEDVAEMSAAAAAMHLGADHAVGAILGLADIAFDRLVEARPARAALELGVEANSGRSQPAQANTPLRCSFNSGLEPGRSVPCLRRISYCCGVSWARHSASVFLDLELSRGLLSSARPGSLAASGRPQGRTGRRRVVNRIRRSNISFSVRGTDCPRAEIRVLTAERYTSRRRFFSTYRETPTLRASGPAPSPGRRFSAVWGRPRPTPGRRPARTGAARPGWLPRAVLRAGVSLTRARSR